MKPISPVNSLPVVVLVVFLAMVAVEAVLGLADLGLFGISAKGQWRIGAAINYGFSTEIFDYVRVYGLDLSLLKNFVTYPFISGSTLGALFGAVLLLALGKFVGEAMSPWGLAAILLASTVMGAVAFGIYAPERVLLIGMYPPAYGLIGAYTYLLWLRIGRAGGNRARAFQMIAVLMGIQLVYGLIFGAHPTWVAELAGFVTGGVLSLLVSPGGWRAFRARLQERR